METASNVALDFELGHILEDLNRILSELDKQNLQMPAIHIATAIEFIENRAD